WVWMMYGSAVGSVPFVMLLIVAAMTSAFDQAGVTEFTKGCLVAISRSRNVLESVKQNWLLNCPWTRCPRTARFLEIPYAGICGGFSLTIPMPHFVGGRVSSTPSGSQTRYAPKRQQHLVPPLPHQSWLVLPQQVYSGQAATTTRGPGFLVGGFTTQLSI